jgi:hypothetical protein
MALVAFDYGTRDPDSELYSRIAASLAERPVSTWIAPTWPAGSYMQGLFREHPAGLFWPAAALIRLGYPADQAAYAMGLVWSALVFALVPSVAAVWAPVEARVLGWLLQLLPIFFVFRVRANHEPAVLACFLAALLGAHVAGRSWRGVGLLTAALAGLMLVKGFLVLPAALCCGLWLALLPSPAGGSKGPGWRAVALVTAGGLAAVALVYEWAYRHATGQSFVAGYAARSLSVGASVGHDWSPLSIPYNLLFYSGRLLWFAFPWSLVLIAVLWPRRRLGRPRLPLGADARGLFFVAGAVVVYVGLFSLSGRRAERYIYPLYPLVGAAGAVAALRAWPALARACGRMRAVEPYASVVTWILLLGIHLAGARFHLPRVKIWNP